jgi:predicted DNA-binding transcriptional regulator AlpA
MRAVARAAKQVRDAIAAGGGLVDRAEIGRRWGVSRTRVGQLLASRDFPKPVASVGGRPLWLAGDVDEWKANRRPPGRPRKSEPKRGQ